MHALILQQKKRGEGHSPPILSGLKRMPQAGVDVAGPVPQRREPHPRFTKSGLKLETVPRFLTPASLCQARPGRSARTNGTRRTPPWHAEQKPLPCGAASLAPHARAVGRLYPPTSKQAQSHCLLLRGKQWHTLARSACTFQPRAGAAAQRVGPLCNDSLHARSAYSRVRVVQLQAVPL